MFYNGGDNFQHFNTQTTTPFSNQRANDACTIVDTDGCVGLKCSNISSCDGAHNEDMLYENVLTVEHFSLQVNAANRLTEQTQNTSMRDMENAMSHELDKCLLAHKVARNIVRGENVKSNSTSTGLTFANIRTTLASTHRGQNSSMLAASKEMSDLKPYLCRLGFGQV